MTNTILLGLLILISAIIYSLFNMGGLVDKIVFKSSVDKVNKSTLPNELWKIAIKDIDGNNRTLQDYTANKKLFIFVNVACKCGLTGDQYLGLVELYNQYSSKGLQVLGFPSGQFMNQEFSKESEIKDFVSEKFKVEFPMFSKIEVNGSEMHEVYRYLKSKTPELNTKDGLKNIPWNFGKFLVDADGKVINFYHPKTKPQELEGIIKERLGLI
jgi:glutathione peroxidase